MRFLKYLLESGFKDSADQDYPDGESYGVIFFNKDETYKKEGMTHGLLSHAIKHLKEFVPQFVQSITNEMQKFLKTKTCYFYKEGKIQEVSNYTFSEDTILNTLDMINDKIMFNKPLYPEEKLLYAGSLRLEKKFKEIINFLTQDATFIDNNNTDKNQILDLINKKTIKYYVEDHNAVMVHFFNKKLDAILITYKGDIRSLFTLHKHYHTGNWYDKGGKKILNPVLSQILKSL